MLTQTHLDKFLMWAKVMPAIVFVALAFSPSAGFALLPATSKEILCNSTHVVLATVLKATPIDFRIDSKTRRKITSNYCTPQNTVNLTIEVLEILAVKNETASLPKESAISIGKKIEINSSLFGISPRSSKKDHKLIKNFPFSKEPASSKQVSKMFLGKQFIFSITIQQGYDWSKSYEWGKGVYKNMISKPPYFATWHIAPKSLVIDILKHGDGNSCPKLIQ